MISIRNLKHRYGNTTALDIRSFSFETQRIANQPVLTFDSEVHAALLKMLGVWVPALKQRQFARRGLVIRATKAEARGRGSRGIRE